MRRSRILREADLRTFEGHADKIAWVQPGGVSYIGGNRSAEAKAIDEFILNAEKLQSATEQSKNALAEATAERDALQAFRIPEGYATVRKDIAQRLGELGKIIDEKSRRRERSDKNLTQEDVQELQSQWGQKITEAVKSKIGASTYRAKEQNCIVTFKLLDSGKVRLECDVYNPRSGGLDTVSGFCKEQFDIEDTLDDKYVATVAQRMLEVFERVMKESKEQAEKWKNNTRPP
jgi:hypothetical protein